MLGHCHWTCTLVGVVRGGHVCIMGGYCTGLCHRRQTTVNLVTSYNVKLPSIFLWPRSIKVVRFYFREGCRPCRVAHGPAELRRGSRS